jgi:hypothetical protein
MVLPGIIDEHLIMLITPRSFYVLARFQEDHWIIVVEKMGKNQNPKFFTPNIISIKEYLITLNARCKRSTA